MSLKNPEERKAIEPQAEAEAGGPLVFLEAKDFSPPSSSKKTTAIKAVSESPKTEPSSEQPKTTVSPLMGPCLRCRAKTWHERSSCPAFKTPCSNCANPGHTTAACL